jgi:hypothetical protein
MEDKNIYPIDPDRVYTLRYELVHIHVKGSVLIETYLKHLFCTPDLSTDK